MSSLYIVYNIAGHTSVKMCKRITSSIDIFKAVRKMYLSRKGFNEHSTKRHSVPNSYKDQLKGMWFCLKNDFFKWNESSEAPRTYELGCNGIASQKVPNNLLDVKEKGEKKIMDNFNEKLYTSFPDLHFQILAK